MGLAGLKGLQGLQGLIAGLSPFDFDLALATFTARMDKRLTPGPFATAPIVQGDANNLYGLNDDDIAILPGTAINGAFYPNMDMNQGSVVLWWTPEYSSADLTGSGDHFIFYADGDENIYLDYQYDFNRFRLQWGGIVAIDESMAITAGTTYCIVVRWDAKNVIDGTNYACLSVDDVHTYGGTSPIVSTSLSSIYLGYVDADQAGSGIVEGLTIYRRPLFDGTYGVDAGNGDEINRIWAVGAGADPCLVTGSWDVCFCLPTNSTAEELVTGTGEAWSHPHSSEIVEHAFLEDGGYLGDEYAPLFNANDTGIDCGSGATLDDLCDAEMTMEAWIRADGWGENGNGRIVAKGISGASGWEIFLNSDTGLQGNVFCATTNATSTSGLDEFTYDRKWHHVVFYFNDAGDRKIYYAVDGIWVSSYPTQTAAVGAIDSDAAELLHIGNRTDDARTFDGCIGWVRLSDNDRYVHGTDFIPPRQMPGADGNTIEQWAMNEGTGAVITATVTTPGNDGTLANGTWEEQWDQEGSPVIPYTVEFDGTASVVNCGSAAIIDDLADDAMTVEGWVNPTDFVGVGGIIGKGQWATEGWVIYKSGGNAYVVLDCLTSDPTPVSGAIPDANRWFHFAFTWDDAGDRKLRLFIDGILVDTSAVAGVGAIVSDAADNLYIGRLFGTESYMTGKVGWARISDSIRYTDNFVPPARLNTPAPDGNTIAQWNFRDGAGTTLLDETVNNVDGTITSGIWRLTPDAEIDSPGQRVYNWGYVLGCDAVDEGMYQQQSGLDAGQNYVARLPIRYEGVRAQPQIIAYDATNGAAISTFLGPKLTGLHSGGNGSATLIVATGAFPQSLVGAELYNITDGSSTTITAVSGDMTTITGVLAGGTDDDWDTGDVFMIVVADEWVWVEPFCFELPTIARNGAAADCDELHFKCTNAADEGVLYWEQVELLENLIDNPSLETGAGNPWIPDGWTNVLLDAGDTEQELTIIHSGGSSVEWNVGAISGEYIERQLTLAVDKFLMFGSWHYGNGTDSLRNISSNGILQYSNAVFTFVLDAAAYWTHHADVRRASVADPTIIINPDNGAPAGDRFIDDIYAIGCDDVSLTVTPANQANSMEGAGIRVDGRDGLSQPIPAGELFATEGWIRWLYTPRHDANIVRDFYGNDTYLCTFRRDGNNYILVFWDNNSIMTLFIRVAGVNTTVNWNPATLNAGTEYLIEVKYNATQIELIVDGVTQITVIPGAGIDFGALIPDMAYWGTYSDMTRQVDSVFAAP